MSDIVKFSIPGEPKYVQMLRLAINSIASQSGFNVEQVEDINVAVSEACKLVTCHGQEMMSEFYDVIVEIDDEKIKISISDFSSGEHTLIKKCKQCFKCPEDGNLSEFVMETLMDSVDVALNDKGNKKIEMVKKK